jgi:tetratricopeptide (TPR) repeat protein
LPHSFKESLIRETHLTQYRVEDPSELPSELRTGRWNLLCESLASYKNLDRRQQVGVTGLLSSLCLYPAVAKYIAPVSAQDIAKDESCAALAYTRANARFMLHGDYDTPYHVDEFRTIATNAPLGTVTRFNALMHMIVQSARFAKDVDTVEYWASVTLREMQDAKSSFDDFTYALLMSRYYRGASFGAQMRRDRERLVQEMDLAEEYACSLRPADEVQQILADENMHPLMQSRTKEAIWLGDLDLAEARARRMIGVDPLDPRALMEVGEVLVSKGDIAQAAKFYRSSAELGPPGTAIAWFMAAQCYESLDDPEHTSDCYLASLRVDPLGISAAERLAEITKLTGNASVNQWAEMRLQELRQQEQAKAN